MNEPHPHERDMARPLARRHPRRGTSPPAGSVNAAEPRRNGVAAGNDPALGGHYRGADVMLTFAVVGFAAFFLACIALFGSTKAALALGFLACAVLYREPD